MKLYPPIIDGIIPAFSGTVLTVPFSMNRAVGNSDFTGFVVKIKTINGDLIGVISTSAAASNEVRFNIPESMANKLNVGQFYKVQLAYKNNETAGYYSTVGIVKYTSQPTVIIENLSIQEINNHQYSYVCSYTNSDSTEKMYSSNFILYKNDSIILQSGEIIHNSSEDDIPTEQSESYSFDYIFDDNSNYSIQVVVTTVNKMTIYSPFYRLYDANNIDSEIEDFNFIAELDYESGCINLKLSSPVGNSKNLSGAFLISRKGSDLNVWEEFKRFELFGELSETFLLKDDTVVHGVTYDYSIQQYNQYGVYSKRKKIDEPVTAYFEHMFLIDAAGRKLKVRFNPKMTTFKKDLLESKVDTIGSKYPYILKNGSVDYKEFALSGLISYQMDDIYTFLNSEENELIRNTTAINQTALLEEYEKKKTFGENISSTLQTEIATREQIKSFNSTDLTDENIAKEKEFKLAVLDWLTNGEPKILKTPTEGNYIVRLMNVTLSPQETLGRMLHSFNCIAYEIADFIKEDLVAYNFMTIGAASQKVLIAGVDLYDKALELKKNGSKNDYIVLNHSEAQRVEIINALPGTEFKLDDQKIIINSTGNFSSSGRFSEISINKKSLEDLSLVGGQVIYTYSSDVVQNFGQVAKQSLHDEVSKRLTNFYSEKPLSTLNDIKNDIVRWYYFKCEKKQIIDIYVDLDPEISPFEIDNAKGYKYYYDYSCTNPVGEEGKISKLNRLSNVVLYRIRYGVKGLEQSDVNDAYVTAISQETIKANNKKLGFILTGNNAKTYYTNAGFYSIGINELYTFSIKEYAGAEANKTVVLNKTYMIKNPNFTKNTLLKIHRGLIPYGGYCVQNKEYFIESTDSELIKLKKEYNDWLEKYKNNPSGSTTINEVTITYESLVNDTWNKYIKRLEEVV